MKTNPKFLKTIENLGWNINSETSIEKWCDNDKDIVIERNQGESLKTEIENRALNFDPEEEFELFIEAKQNGLSGCPSYMKMLEDCIQENEFYEELWEAIKDIPEYLDIETNEDELPEEVEFTINDILDDEEIDLIMEKITDKLSDEYGFCINDFTLDIDIKAKNINWDTKE